MTGRGSVEETVRRYAAAWAAGDREAWLDTFAEGAMQEDPVGDPVRRGREEIGGFWDAARAAYEWIEILPRSIVVCGPEAVMEWTITGRVPGGIVSFAGVDVFTFDDDARITSIRAFWSRPALHAQREALASAAATGEPLAPPPGLPEVRIVVEPAITADQLFAFYELNGICETGFGKQVASRVLDHPHVIAAAFAGEELVGLARATFDGLSASIMELSLDLRWQGTGTEYRNGSLVEADPHRLGERIGRALLAELDRLGCTFVTAYLVEGVEEEFYASIGLSENTGHSVWYRDRRPYVTGDSP